MKKFILPFIGLIGLGLFGMWLINSKSGGSDSIIKMAKRGASETEMLAAVAKSNRPAPSADEVISLKAAGVPNNVIIEMLNKPASAGR